VSVDIEECLTEMDDCHVNAACNNTFGSFECTCVAGFVGNGVNCTSKTYNGCASGRKILVATSTKAHPLCTNLIDTTWNVLFTILVFKTIGLLLALREFSITVYSSFNRC